MVCSAKIPTMNFTGFSAPEVRSEMAFISVRGKSVVVAPHVMMCAKCSSLYLLFFNESLASLPCVPLEGLQLNT